MTTTIPPLADPLLKVNEVARALRKSRATTYQLLRAGDLRSVKIGGSRRVRQSDLDAYVAKLPPTPVGTHPDNPNVPDTGWDGATGTGPGRNT